MLIMMNILLTELLIKCFFSKIFSQKMPGSGIFKLFPFLGFETLVRSLILK